MKQPLDVVEIKLKKGFHTWRRNREDGQRDDEVRPNRQKEEEQRGGAERKLKDKKIRGPQGES